MADVKNAAATEEFNDDGSKNPDYVAPTGDGEGAGAGTENKGKDDKEGEDDGANGGEGEGAEFDDKIDPAKPPEIPTRTSNLQHIIARKNKKIEKLENKSGEDGGEGAGDGSGDGAGDGSGNGSGNSDVTAEVEKAIKPLMDILGTQADKDEFEQLIKDEPDAAKYANHIKAYMGHEAYKSVSPSVIYHHLAFNAAKAIGAKKKAAADKEANLHKGGGRNATIVDKGTVGNLPSAEDIDNMSEADFEKMENDARQGKYSK